MYGNNTRNRSNERMTAGTSSQYLEQENNELTENLLQKTRMMKDLSIQIGDEVRSQNSLLNDMDSDFDNSANVLTSTMRRLGLISKSGGTRFLCYLILFCLAVFFVIYWLIR